MDDFKAIYRILRFLRDRMDCEYFDSEGFCASAFKVSEPKFDALLAMLLKSGYIEGVVVTEDWSGNYDVEVRNARITLRGLEYLQENSAMRKVGNALKGVADVLT